jgi:hypothetical protein
MVARKQRIRVVLDTNVLRYRIVRPAQFLKMLGDL